MYTSGTSGLPKGVMLTYGNLQSDVDAAIEHAAASAPAQVPGRHPAVPRLRHDRDDARADPARAQPSSTSPASAPSRTLNAIREHKVSLMFGVPSMYAAIARLKDAQARRFRTHLRDDQRRRAAARELREAFREASACRSSKATA